jgi:hypothetical protein
MTQYATKPKPNRKKTTAIILSIVGATVLLMGGCIALVAKTGTESYQAAKVGAEQFLTRLEKHDYAAASAAMTDEAKAVALPGSIADIVSVLEKRRGRMLRYEGPQGWYENSRNGTTTIQLSYKVIFERGQTHVTLVLLNQNGTWRPQSFQFAL